MKDELHHRLETEFGPPTSDTKYVLRWHLGEGLDIVVEKRGRLGKLWTAWPGGEEPPLYFGVRRPPGDNVNSNVYSVRHAPSLATRDLLELWVAGTRELEATVSWLSARRAGLPPPVIEPPAADDPEPAEWLEQGLADVESDGAHPTPATAVGDEVVPTAGGQDRPRHRRMPIPQQVRWEVWRRDEGRCVRCESREGLEFDHIIPVAEGGSSTARNIELLCEKCNRRKGAKING